MKKVYRTYGTPLKETIYTSMEFQLKTEKEKGIKAYLKNGVSSKN